MLRIFQLESINFIPMEVQYYNVLGVMSGTSLDGVDLAWIQLEKNNGWKFKIHQATTIQYSAEWKQRLKEAVHYSSLELKQLDEDYTELLANIISNFHIDHQIKDLHAVCSHGHTILHQPENGITLQIGNLPKLAIMIGQQVICDFRVQDVQLGGQGAPLVPIGDRLLFAEYDYCLNLGGFANISYEEKEDRVAFDICPVNVVMNHFAEELCKPYDSEGKIAASGRVDQALLLGLNSLGFYTKDPPKSLGLEWVQEHIFPMLEDSGLQASNVLRTFVEHVAIQIAAVIPEDTTVLVTGGGAYNNFLIERIKSHANARVVIPSKEIIEYKEALVFGLLGVLKLRTEINCLKSVTGAIKDHCSGKIFKP
ncbi:anhydro-N-acetylmuramic acid kinase [Sungkyunkwania multivorans]|uniref:Anhydro-N-acetylmuramic acid kinase n=1 Tax=Sungkyunkwania multivorans TaxID=1173618 RepID=A0ABW3CZ85_9FLAO